MKYRLIALALLCYPVCASAQYKTGKLLEDGVWKAPTPQMALDAIMADPNRGREAAVAVLRQTIETRSPAELDAFADELGRLIVEGTQQQEFVATLALRVASKQDNDGIPYRRAVYVLIRAYESLKDHDYEKARSVLADVGMAGGADYLRGIFESSMPPEKPCIHQGLEIPPGEIQCPHRRNAWCDAGDVLIRYTEAGPAPEDVWPLCFGSVKTERGWMRIIY